MTVKFASLADRDEVRLASGGAPSLRPWQSVCTVQRRRRRGTSKTSTLLPLLAPCVLTRIPFIDAGIGGLPATGAACGG